LKNNNTPKPSGSHPVIAQETGRISEREPEENRTDIKTETGTEPDAKLSMNHKPRKEGVSREGTFQGDSRHQMDSTGGRVDWFNRSATEIVARLAEAAQENVVRGTTEIELVQPIRDLLALGADFEHDILPAIAERVPKLTTPLRSWGARWLRDEIMARKAARLNRHGHRLPRAAGVARRVRASAIHRSAATHGSWRRPRAPGK